MTRQELNRLQDRLFRSVVLALDHEVSDDTDEDLTLVDVLAGPLGVEPSEELELRELHAYLRDAVGLLPERQRLVIVGYFLEGRTSQELARFLGVTESRICAAAHRGPAQPEARHRGPVRRCPRGLTGRRPGGPAPGRLRRLGGRGVRLEEPPLPLGHRVRRPRGTPAPRRRPPVTVTGVRS